MNKTTITSLIVIIVLLLLGWLLFWRNNAEAPIVDDGTAGEMEENDMLITAKHEYSNGTHVVAGEVNLPTPCHILNTNVQVTLDTDPDQATIDFEAITQAEACVQIITPTRFKIDFKADENAVIAATWNGEKVRLNLIPVAEGESLDDFEIFIKG